VRATDLLKGNQASTVGKGKEGIGTIPKKEVFSFQRIKILQRLLLKGRSRIIGIGKVEGRAEKPGGSERQVLREP